MSVTAGVITAVIMTIIMIGLVIWYLGRGYSYKHTVDELPDQEPSDKNE
jgi:hypothetical protein